MKGVYFMKPSFKETFLSVISKNADDKMLSLLKNHNKTLEHVKNNSSIKLNRLKYLCLNCNNLNELLSKNLDYIYLNTLVDPSVLDDIHLANIEYPFNDKLIEQLFISNRLLQSIEKNCNFFNRYINIIKELSVFVSSNNIDLSSLISPFFQFYKDKKGYPMAFLCPFDKNYFINNNFNFKIYGFLGKHKNLSKKVSYMEANLKYNENIPSSLELKKIYIRDNSNLECGDKALQYLINKLIPEFNEVFKEITISSDLKIHNNFKTNLIYSLNNKNTNLDFYLKNGFVLKENNFYLKIN